LLEILFEHKSHAASQACSHVTMGGVRELVVGITRLLGADMMLTRRSVFVLMVITAVASWKLSAQYSRGADSAQVQQPEWLARAAGVVKTRQAPASMQLQTQANFARIHADKLKTSVCQAVQQGRSTPLASIFSLEEMDSVKKLKKQLAAGQAKVVIGAGGTTFAGWLSTDYPIVDFLNHTRIGAVFDDNSISEVLAEHVFEHFTIPQAVIALQAMWCVMVDGGRVRIAVPDGAHPGAHFAEKMFGAWAIEKQDNGYPGHYTAWTEPQLTRVLKASGFGAVALEWWDAERQFHYRSWDPNQGGPVARTLHNDRRNRDGGLNYTSLLVDAFRRHIPPP
jgi:predicted SAM-dependent methyltransferase